MTSEVSEFKVKILRFKIANLSLRGVQSFCVYNVTIS